MDWGAGTYEHIAAQLLPATHAALAQAAPAPGERVLDVGCGTGSATLLAAERGAQATGVDPAERLLEVARDAARARGVQASFLRGEAAALPVADASADAVVSVFGVVFAPDATAACAELARVTAPAGRIVLSAWIPAGALFDVARVRARAMAAPDTTPAPPPFAWHDREALSAAFSPWGLTAATDERRLAFAAASRRSSSSRSCAITRCGWPRERAWPPPSSTGPPAWRCRSSATATRSRAAFASRAGTSWPPCAAPSRPAARARGRARSPPGPPSCIDRAPKTLSPS